MKKRYLAMIILPFVLSACLDYSDGSRAGVVTKFSRKGIFCKTWEGELNLGGLRNKTSNVPSGDGKSSSTVTSVVANTFEFTVEDEALVPKIQAALESGERVTLGYQQEVFTFCRSNTNYFIKSVR